MNCIRVRWIDSCTTVTGWVLSEEYKGVSPAIVQTVGFVVKEIPGPDGYIEIVQSVADLGGKHEQFCNGIVIPRSAILGITPIEIEGLDVSKH